MPLTLLAGPANSGKVATLLDRYLAAPGAASPDEAEHLLAQSWLRIATKNRIRHDAEGEEAARQVLARAGATRVFNFGLSVAGRVGGFVRLGEHLDAQLQTRLRNLHVCDGSVIPDAMRGTPTLTLLSLSRYLARHLAAA